MARMVLDGRQRVAPKTRTSEFPMAASFGTAACRVTRTNRQWERGSEESESPMSDMQPPIETVWELISDLRNEMQATKRAMEEDVAATSLGYAYAFASLAEAAIESGSLDRDRFVAWSALRNMPTCMSAIRRPWTSSSGPANWSPARSSIPPNSVCARRPVEGPSFLGRQERVVPLSRRVHILRSATHAVRRR